MDFNRLTAISLLSLLSIFGCDSNPSQTEESSNGNTSKITTDKKSSNFICSHLLVKTDLIGDSLTLTIEDKSYQLSQTESASGSKYVNQSNSISFWQKGDSATLEFNGQRFSNCEKVTLQQSVTSNRNLKLPFSARGNEPGWLLNISQEQFELNADYGQTTIIAPISKPLIIELGVSTQFDTDQGALTFVAEDKLCHDSMSGMPHPYTVTIQTEQKTMQGCGGEPRSLLSKNQWTVLTLANQMLVQDSRISLKFSPDMQLAGVASCNRYTTSYTLTGEGLSIGTITTTLMACDPALMEQEASFLKYLASVERFDINDSGQLVLYTSQGASLLAKPEPQ